MSAVITVRVTASEWVDAERADVALRVAVDGAERAPVVARATAAAAEVTGALEPLTGAAVTRWSSDRIAVWAERPWNADGKQLPPVYHATIGVTARFADVERMAEFVDRFAAVDDITVVGITWDLTEERRTAVTAEVRRAAVRDAAEKASLYADAAGLGAVHPVAVADLGMLGDPDAGAEGAHPKAAMMAMRDAGGAPALAFTPDRIEVAAVVDARFAAD